ncbi:hypothetical protein [Paenibacillus abyssi]|uniref:Uncharacterized protein n=1 Tax=Paenibacillus abyssi TaxID=1340531 RepID=A0A917D7X6_9BACL|nr:hypothetical protein [Paenibacillus abyssi]GGG13559.1 hypothetical protein GCM10010916_33100 [Paenibacillus abyssi]
MAKTVKSKYLSENEQKTIRRWIPIMIKQKSRTEEQKENRAKTFLKLRYKILGSGKTRIVYDLKNGYVLKIAISRRGLRSNQREYDIYTRCSRRMRRYLCPVMEHGHGWIIMKKLKRRAVLSDKDEMTLSKIRNRFLKEKIVARSLREKNLARYKKRFVVIDYGSFRFINQYAEEA